VEILRTRVLLDQLSVECHDDENRLLQNPATALTLRNAHTGLPFNIDPKELAKLAMVKLSNQLEQGLKMAGVESEKACA
jgi:hypothetical protein